MISALPILLEIFVCKKDIPVWNILLSFRLPITVHELFSYLLPENRLRCVRLLVLLLFLTVFDVCFQLFHSPVIMTGGSADEIRS